MTAPVMDLALRRALRRDVEALAAEHPEVTGEAARERCSEWLAGEEPDEHAVEPGEHAAESPASAGRRDERPASRGD
jgi:hypothetical protein